MQFLGEDIWYFMYHIPLVNFTLPRKLPGELNIVLQYFFWVLKINRFSFVMLYFLIFSEKQTVYL